MATIEKVDPMLGAIYLCAPVNALVEGLYEEKIPLATVLRHGDFGLGTFDHLDGEMVILHGRIYQIRIDGSVREVSSDALTPFACVTFFHPTTQLRMSEEIAYEEFWRWLEDRLPSPNLFYAIHIEGRFRHITARSVPKTENYRPLVEVAKEQHVFEFADIEGVLVGFYTPAFMYSMSVPGLHLHFLSADLQHGGHLLECQPQDVRIEIQGIHSLHLTLPLQQDYLHGHFDRDISADLNEVET